MRFSCDLSGTPVQLGDGGIEGIDVCETPGGCADEPSDIWCDSTTGLCWTEGPNWIVSLSDFASLDVRCVSAE